MAMTGQGTLTALPMRRRLHYHSALLEDFLVVVFGDDPFWTVENTRTAHSLADIVNIVGVPENTSASCCLERYLSDTATNIAL